MGRRNWQTYADRLNRGINQQAELAVPGEVADARNVWAPEGKLVSRPGRAGLGSYDNSSEGILSSPSVVTEISGVFTSRSGAFTATFDPASLDRLYVGTTTTLYTLDSPYDWSRSTTPYKLVTSVSYPIDGGGNENTAKTTYTCEYWNGSKWVFIPSVCNNGGPFMGVNGTNLFALEIPYDWATTTVGSVTNTYFVRFTVTGVATSAIDFENRTSARFGIDSFPAGYPIAFSTVRAGEKNHCYTAANATAQRLAPAPGPDNAITIDGSSIQDFDVFTFGRKSPLASVATVQDEPALYPAFNGRVYRVDLEQDKQTFSIAEPEQNESIVGSTAVYSKDYISQLTTFPGAQAIVFFLGRLWCADGNILRWSEPYPYHRVFPDFNWASSGNNDLSDIVAIVPFGEQLVIFKRRSIYVAVASGTTSFGTGKFTVVRVVSGIGCAATASVCPVLGRLIFLSDDGIYAFDGSPDVRKITLSKNGADRIGDFIDRINSGLIDLSNAVNWTSKNAYLLAVPIDDAQAPDHIIVWDYKRDAFWIWDDVSVVGMLDGAAFDYPDFIYTLDVCANVSIIGVGYSNHFAAFNSYVVSHRIQTGDGNQARLRGVGVKSSNKTRNVSVEVYRNDDEIVTSSGTIDLTDSLEPTWSDTITDGVTKWAQKQRRSAGIAFRVDGEHFQVKLSHSVVGQPFELDNMTVDLLPLKRSV